MIKEGIWHILQRKGGFPKIWKKKRREGNCEVITLYYGLGMRKACSVLHLALEKQIALRKGMPWVGITVQQCCEQISLASQSTKCRNVLQWKVPRPGSLLWLKELSSLPHMAPSVWTGSSKMRTVSSLCLSQLCNSFIHSTNFYWVRTAF